MRAAAGDRCRSALLALCLAALLTIAPAAGLGAEYRIAQDGTSYHAVLDLEDTERFEFYETGMLGERLPLRVSEVMLSGDCDPCPFEWSGNTAIIFERGNYSLSYQGPVRDNHFHATFESPRQISVFLPAGLDVRNPALGMISHGGTVLDSSEGGISVAWNSTRTAEIRFYDEGRENLLYIFANFWIIIAVVMLIPFLLSMKKRE